MPSTPFGDHLKRERELRGVTLEEVAAATRISPRFLEALENEQWDRLPGGAFNRGFIRSVARYLGLDEESMVAEYALESKTLSDGSPGGMNQAGMPRDYRPLVMALAGAAIVLILLFVAIHFYRARARARLSLEQPTGGRSAESAPRPATAGLAAEPVAAAAPGGSN